MKLLPDEANGSHRPIWARDAHTPVRYRTLFLSDVHLGCRGCQADLLLDFLRSNEADTYYLVGDMVDGWRLRTRWYWPSTHNEIANHFLRQARKGAKVIYLPGNHDEFARDLLGRSFGGFAVTDRMIHETADGRRFLVLHGDQFDVVIRHVKWLAAIGAHAYNAALLFNTHFNRLRRALGYDYWSISAWAKLKVKRAVNFIGAFEDVLVREAAREGVDGVICGHIHHASMREINGHTYVNIGDFVESCTALAEFDDGRLEILTWRRFAAEPLVSARPAAAPVNAAA